MQTHCRYCEDKIEETDETDVTKNFHKGCATECCKNCGKCCHTILIPTRFEWSDMDSRIFYEKRNITAVKDNMGGITLVMTGNPCAHFKRGEGCNIYENRPYWCRVYEPKDDTFHASLCPLTVDFDADMAEFKVEDLKPKLPYIRNSELDAKSDREEEEYRDYMAEK